MRRFNVSLGTRAFEVTLLARTAHEVRFLVNGKSYEVEVAPLLALQSGNAGASAAPISIPTPARSSSRASTGELRAPMPGIVTKILVKEGDTVQHGQTLLVIEAMKMENNLTAGKSGTVKKIHAAAGKEVDGGALLIELA